MFLSLFMIMSMSLTSFSRSNHHWKLRVTSQHHIDADQHAQPPLS